MEFNQWDSFKCWQQMYVLCLKWQMYAYHILYIIYQHIIASYIYCSFSFTSGRINNGTVVAQQLRLWVAETGLSDSTSKLSLLGFYSPKLWKILLPLTVIKIGHTFLLMFIIQINTYFFIFFATQPQMATLNCMLCVSLCVICKCQTTIQAASVVCECI